MTARTQRKRSAGYEDSRSLFDAMRPDLTLVGLQPGEIIVDSFAGGGGASLGITWALGVHPHIAINHDREAIALHKANHPQSKHFPEDIWHVDPVAACRGRPVGLMWLSPDCKHFSKAKGGKPVSKKIRGLAWTAVRWATAVRPRVIILENVEEFQSWGPVLRATNQPDPARKGHTFRRFVRRLERLGYAVDWRELRGSDYGAPTIRKRLFLIARCDGQPIIWPSATHAKLATASARRCRPWRTAAECIEWSLPCPSIFDRSKPLAENTLKRIARGIRRYVIESPRPYIVSYYSAKRDGDDRTADLDAPLPTQPTENKFGLVIPHITKFRGGATGSDISEPMPTVTANSFIKRPGGCAPLGVVSPVLAPIIVGVGGRAGQSPERTVDQPYQTITAKGDAALVSPLLVPMQHENRATSVDEPVQTVTTQSNKFNVVSPLLVPTTHQGDTRAHAVDEPTRTITGAHRGEQALVSAFLKPRYGEDPNPARRGGQGQAPRARPLTEPMPVVVPTGNGGDLVATFLAKHYGDRGQLPGSDMGEPVSTITACDHNALVSSLLVNMRGTDDSQLTGRSIEAPMPTISGGGIHAAEVRAFLIAYYGNEKEGGSLHDPTRTVTSKERFGLVTVQGVEYAIVDIGMRMLAPRELYRAQGFPDSYRIDIEYKGKPLTKTAQVRMCGNSVCPPVAAALVRANIGGVSNAMPSELTPLLDDEIAHELESFDWVAAEDVACRRGSK